jgi:hypothetical protein
MSAKPLTPIQQRAYICQIVPGFRHVDLVEVFRFITSQIPGVKINTHSDGSSVNLDRLTDEQVLTIYTYVVAKADEQSA